MSEKPTSLEFLQAVYLNERLPLPLRLRAAIECLPFESPRLTAVSVGYYTGNTFAQRLDRGIDASERAKLIEGRVIDKG